MKASDDLLIADVAKIAGCHPNTVRNYVKKGVLNPSKDVNGFARFSVQDAQRLRTLLSARWPMQQANESHNINL